jgi:Fe-Mn family superoxide dismutase
MYTVMNAELPELPYQYNALENSISEQVMEWHHDTHHAGYVDGVNSAEEGLEEQRETGDFSDSASLLTSFTHNYAGHVLHTLFWNNMSPDGGGEASGELRDKIEEDFGSYENWRQEFEEAAKSASGWALLVYIPREDELHNVPVDNHDEGAVWGAHPVLSLDVWEHSYYHDYGPARGDFIDSFFEVVDWSHCEQVFDRVSG